MSAVSMYKPSSERAKSVETSPHVKDCVVFDPDTSWRSMPCPRWTARGTAL
jgi:hypothetical protein